MRIVDPEHLHGLPDEVAERLAELLHRLGHRDRNKGVVMLLQLELVVAIMAQRLGAWYVLCWKPPLPVLGMPRTTAECYLSCLELLRAQCGLGDVAKLFLRRQRAVATDGDAAIEK